MPASLNLMQSTRYSADLDPYFDFAPEAMVVAAPLAYRVVQRLCHLSAYTSDQQCIQAVQH